MSPFSQAHWKCMISSQYLGQKSKLLGDFPQKVGEKREKEGEKKEKEGEKKEKEGEKRETDGDFLRYLARIKPFQGRRGKLSWGYYFSQ